MEHKKKIVSVAVKTMVDKEIDIYIADDGKEFDSAAQCSMYEKRKDIEGIIESMKIGYFDDLEDNRVYAIRVNDVDEWDMFKLYFGDRKGPHNYNIVNFEDDIAPDCFPAVILYQTSDGGDYRDVMYVQLLRTHLNHLMTIIHKIEKIMERA